jgi:hypothetical protein
MRREIKMDVKVIRLFSGEEVICFGKEVEGGWKVEKPGMLVPTENGVGIMNMMPYTTIGEETTFIKDAMVGFVTNPVPGLEEQYRSINQTIVTPDKSIIL